MKWKAETDWENKEGRGCNFAEKEEKGIKWQKRITGENDNVKRMKEKKEKIEKKEEKKGWSDIEKKEEKG